MASSTAPGVLERKISSYGCYILYYEIYPRIETHFLQCMREHPLGRIQHHYVRSISRTKVTHRSMLYRRCQFSLRNRFPCKFQQHLRIFRLDRTLLKNRRDWVNPLSKDQRLKFDFIEERGVDVPLPPRYGQVVSSHHHEPIRFDLEST